MQNWSLGVFFAFYVDLMVICCEFHAENIEGVPLVAAISCHYHK
jgi:hypothetical protein